MSFKSVNGESRGVYLLAINWYSEGHEHDGRKSEGFAGKEFPHPTTESYNFNVFGFEPNPRPDIGQIRDGNWHGFVAVVWNQGQQFPTMALWYNPNTTFDWKDFVFLGSSEDRPENVMLPGPLLTKSIEHDPEQDIWGPDFFKVKHVVEIRIDDILPDQIEVRNMYAANVSVYEDSRLYIQFPPFYLKRFLKFRDFSFPVNIKDVAERLGLTVPISVRDIIERLQKNIL